jgi:hypothetical protein
VDLSVILQDIDNWIMRSIMCTIFLYNSFLVWDGDMAAGISGLPKSKRLG